MPRAALVRAIMLNHWYHHRGQLLVYLRCSMCRCPRSTARPPTRIRSPGRGRRGLTPRGGRRLRGARRRPAEATWGFGAAGPPFERRS